MVSMLNIPRQWWQIWISILTLRFAGQSVPARVGSGPDGVGLHRKLSGRPARPPLISECSCSMQLTRTPAPETKMFKHLFLNCFLLIFILNLKGLRFKDLQFDSQQGVSQMSNWCSATKIKFCSIKQTPYYFINGRNQIVFCLWKLKPSAWSLGNQPNI